MSAPKKPPPEAPPSYGFGVKPTRQEREARLVLVEEMLFRRIESPSRIERTLAPEFGVRTRTIRTYIQRVRERAKMRAQRDPDPRITRELLTEAAVDIYTSAKDRVRIVDGKEVADPDNRTALRAIYSLMDLHGLRVHRHELTGPGGAPLQTSPADAAKQLSDAIERVVQRSVGASSTPSDEPK